MNIEKKGGEDHKKGLDKSVKFVQIQSSCLGEVR